MKASPVIIRLLSLVILLLATPAMAQDSVDTMLAQGRYGDALAATDAILQTNPANSDAHLLRGYALLGLGQVDAAAQAAGAAHASDAAYLYAMLRGHIAGNSQSHNIANFWYRRAHDAATSPDETAAAVAFARQAQAQRNWVWGAEFSVQRSDNLNFATDETEVQLGGIPFTLADENTARAGTAISAAFSGKYKAINQTNHLLQIGALATLSYEQGAGVTARGAGLALDGQYRFDAASMPVTLRYGITAQRSFPTDGTASTTQSAHLTLSGAVTDSLGWSAGLNARRSFDTGPVQTDLSFAAGLNGTLPGGHSYGLHYTRGQVRSDNANAAADYRSLRASFAPSLPDLPVSLSVFAEANQRNYTMETPFFGGQRRDTTTSYGITLAPADFTVMGMTPSVTLRQTRRNSNVDINDATSQDIFVGLRSSF